MTRDLVEKSGYYILPETNNEENFKESLSNATEMPRPQGLVMKGPLTNFERAISVEQWTRTQNGLERP